MAGIQNVAAVSLAIGYPTLAAVPHMLVNGYKNVLAVALATDITFKQAEKAKAFLAVCVPALFLSIKCMPFLCAASL
jgi:large subunit ribosomal protein LP0